MSFPKDDLQGLFGDGLFEGPLEADPDQLPVESAVAIPWRPLVMAILVSGLIAVSIGWKRVGSEIVADGGIELVGPKVGRLQVGAAVVAGGVKIGRVVAIDDHASEPIARLEFDPSIADRLTADARWYVKPLGAGGSDIGVEVIGSDAGGPLPKRVRSGDEPYRHEVVDQFLEGVATGRDIRGVGLGVLRIIPAIIAIAGVVTLIMRSFRFVWGAIGWVVVGLAVVVMAGTLLRSGRLGGEWKGRWLEVGHEIVRGLTE